MIELAFFVAVSIVFLCLLLIWVFSHQAKPFKQITPRELFELVQTFHLVLPSRQIAVRIFAKEDLNFICQTGSKEVAKLFVRERRSIALSWIKATRRRVERVLMLHRLAVRTGGQARLQSEAQLLLNYIAFWLTCTTLSGLIWLLGPFRAKQAVDMTLNVAERLIDRTADLLAGLEPSRLQDVLRTWEQTPA